MFDCKKFCLWVLMFFVVGFFYGCAAPESAITKKYVIDQTTDQGHNVLVLVLDADVESSSTMRQAARADGRGKFDMALAQNGSTQQNAAKGAVGGLMDGVSSMIKNEQSESDYVDSVKPVIPESTEKIPVKIEKKTDIKNQSETFSLQTVAGNNKKFTWLPQTGAYYGGQVRFEFEGCGDLLVPDAAVSIGADGSTDKNQSFYFCGTDYKAGDAEYNNGLASVFSPPGCPAESVTIYYNME